MRRILALVFLLLGLGWCGCHIEAGFSVASGPAESDWRHTRQGWQRRSQWTEFDPVRQPALHPAVVSVMLALVSALVLVAASAPPAYWPPGAPVARKRDGMRPCPLTGTAGIACGEAGERDFPGSSRFLVRNHVLPGTNREE